MINFFTMHWDKIMTILFAGLSAVFAGLSFLVIWLDYRRNNPKVIVKMSHAFANFGGNMVHCVNCSILNKGRRPIKIQRFNFSLKNGETLFYFPNNNSAFPTGFPQFPQELNEMDRFEFLIYLEALVHDLQITPVNVDSLCFADTADNIYSYKIKKKHWRELFNNKK